MTTIEAIGQNGQLAFDGSIITITRKGFFGTVGHGRNTKTLPLRSVSAVQFKPANALLNGYVSFSISGESGRSRAGNGRTDATTDENAVIIMKKHMPAMQAFVDAVQAAITAPASVDAVPSLDPMEQLGKLAALRDAGVVTAEEFDAKKAELLSKF